MPDLFADSSQKTSYAASEIEVLEGLEPVRRRPGMYIGGTDERALHHLAAEILDNSMDEAVAGHASWIEIHLESSDTLCIRDNGRGIPIDSHPKFPDKSALEVILTTLHAGGKFSNKAYQTSGGLHGVGASVVNALSSHLEVEVAREKTLYSQSFAQGEATGKLSVIGKTANRRGTLIRFTPDQEIFGKIFVLNLKRSIKWPSRRPIYLPVLKSDGNAPQIQSHNRIRCRNNRHSASPEDWPII